MKRFLTIAAVRGISGQTTSHMLVRFRSDVIELAPKYVVIHAGTNDIAKNNGLPEKHAADGVHPNIACYKIMEEIILKSL